METKFASNTYCIRVALRHRSMVVRKEISRERAEENFTQMRARGIINDTQHEMMFDLLNLPRFL
jgi:hypothetical protein